jgi:histidyl-tRNA synthetase
VAELRAEGGVPAAVERFERLLPALQKAGLSLADLRASLGEDEAGEAFESLAWIVRTAQGEMPGGARVQFDPTLVRGMGYYTGPIFEMAAAAFASSIAGGGRYDRMIGKMLGREVPACGFSIGFERLIMILGEPGDAVKPASAATPAAAGRIAVLVEGGGDLGGALTAARELRAQGHQVSLELKRRNLGRQLEDFATHGYTGYAIWEAGSAGPGLTVKPLTGGRGAR